MQLEEWFEKLWHIHKIEISIYKKNLQLIRAKSLTMYVTTYDSLLYVYIFTYTYV